LHLPASGLDFHPLCEECRRDDLAEATSGHVHRLCRSAIDAAVHETAPGTFALGYGDGSGFIAFFVGRSDADLNADLKAWVEAPSRPRSHRAPVFAPWLARTGPQAWLGTRALGPIAIGADTGYTHFRFRYAPSAIAAFERECIAYHALGGSEQLDNACHPQPPPDSPWRCPAHG